MFYRTVEPVVSEEEFRVTSEIVKKFSVPGGLGEKLQKILEDRAASTENWVSCFY